MSVLIIHVSVFRPTGASSGNTKNKQSALGRGGANRNIVFISLFHKVYKSTKIHFTDVILKMWGVF